MIALNNKIKDSTNYTYEVCEYKIYLIQQNLTLIYQPCSAVCNEPTNDNNKIINNLIMKFTTAH